MTEHGGAVVVSSWVFSFLEYDRSERSKELYILYPHIPDIIAKLLMDNFLLTKEKDFPDWDGLPQMVDAGLMETTDLAGGIDEEYVWYWKADVPDSAGEPSGHLEEVTR